MTDISCSPGGLTWIEVTLAGAQFLAATFRLSFLDPREHCIDSCRSSVSVTLPLAQASVFEIEQCRLSAERAHALQLVQLSQRAESTW
jgi:hypothetical protein